MGKWRAVLLVAALGSVFVAASPASAKSKPGDPTSWQTELCRRMDSYLSEADIGFAQLRKIDTTSPPQQEHDDLAFGISQVAGAAYGYLYIDRALGLLPVAKPQSIIGPLRRDFVAATDELKRASREAEALPVPVDPDSDAFTAMNADFEAGVQTFREAMHRVYGNTGDRRFDRAILANKECKILAPFSSAPGSASSA